MEKNLAIKFQSIATAFGKVAGLPEVLRKAGEKLAVADDSTRRKIWTAVLGVDVTEVKYSRTVYDRITKRFQLTDAKATELQKASALHGGGKIEACDETELDSLLESF